MQGGIHLVEWGCELLGTALLLLGGLSAVCMDFGRGSPVARALPSHSLRLLLTGILFAGTGALVSVTPIGRRSGAHLNPSVTIAFWMRRHVHLHDLFGYTVSQCAGAVGGAALVQVLWGRMASSVKLGVTEPRRGLYPASASGIEALMTMMIVLTILVMVSSPRTARWTPLGVWVVVAVLVWQGAPWTGTSLNPARSLGPATVLPDFARFWVYVIGPVTGAILAVVAFAAIPDTETLTAKLYHDPSYSSTMRSALPVAP
jgi:aquaporin Z